jgi:Holliday junction resolvase RusA-like endonuclease
MKIIIPDKPIPKMSPRHSRKGFTYNPQKKLMDSLKLLIKGQWKAPPLEGAVMLEVTLYMPIPKSTSKKRTQELLGAYHVKRPDRSNLMKMLEDCMTGIVYKDDSQICDGPTKKIYGDPPRTEINIIDLTV